MLRKVSQFASIALSVIVFALPLSECLTPAAKMSAEERECCRKMAGRCEASVMQSSHSCCQHPASPQSVTASKIQKNDFGPAVAMPIGATFHLPRTIARSSAATFESPPDSPPQMITVLRI
jgi:hypothetical protein